MFLSRAFKVFLIVMVAFAFASVTYAYAAANVVPASKAGDGSGAITGYTVSAIHYVLNSTDPSTIDSVTFTLNSTPVAGSTIRIRLVAAGSWYTCTNVSAAVTCNNGTTLGATVLSADLLQVVVSD